MDIHVTVSSADPQDGRYTAATTCVVIFVAVDATGSRRRSRRGRRSPTLDQQLQANALERIDPPRANIETAMAEQTYSDAGTAPQRRPCGSWPRRPT